MRTAVSLPTNHWWPFSPHPPNPPALPVSSISHKVEKQKSGENEGESLWTVKEENFKLWNQKVQKALGWKCAWQLGDGYD